MADTDDTDDTDELPPVPEMFEGSDEAEDSDDAEDSAATETPDEATTRDLGAEATETVVVRQPRERDDDRAAEAPAGPSRFARARRRALLWNAGWSLVAGVVVLVMASSGRPVDYGPQWSSVLGGSVGIGWAAVLAAIAAGGVGRTSTALVALINLLIGVTGFLLGWINTDVPTVLLVLAAQLAGFGLVQVVTSVRR